MKRDTIMDFLGLEETNHMNHCLPFRFSIENTTISAGKIARLAESGVECLVGDVRFPEYRSGINCYHERRNRGI